VMDNYSLIFEYPNGERVNFSHHYFDPPGFTSIRERVFGSGGAIELAEASWQPREKRGGALKLEVPDAGQDSSYMALAAFVDSIRTKKLPINNAESAMRSTLQAVMATKAIYEKRIVTWEEVAG
jgi:hypothetical protein